MEKEANKSETLREKFYRECTGTKVGAPHIVDPADKIFSWIEAEIKAETWALKGEIKCLQAEKEKFAEPIKMLLLLCEPDGTVVNGFKTKESIIELRKLINELNSK